MWSYSGYYYRGRSYSTAQELTALANHFGAGDTVPTTKLDSQDSWDPFMAFLKENKPRDVKNGEAWPQLLGTWEIIAVPHNATVDTVTGKPVLRNAGRKDMEGTEVRIATFDAFRAANGICGCVYGLPCDLGEPVTPSFRDDDWGTPVLVNTATA